MPRHSKLIGSLTALGLLAGTPAAWANSETSPVYEATAYSTSESVRMEIMQAFDAISAYSAEQRDEAISAARDAMATLDAEIERRADALRDGWSDMTADAQSAAREELNDLRAVRNDIGERLGALQSASSEAWNGVKDAFVSGYEQLAEALTS